MDKGDKIVEQSDIANVQREAPVSQSIGGPAALVPPIQFTAQTAQQMAMFFQQMAYNLSAQAQVQTQPPREQHEKEKNGKLIGQSSSSNLGKSKDFEEPRAPKYDRGRSSWRKQSRTIR